MTDISQEEIKEALEKTEKEAEAAEIEGISTEVTSIADQEKKTGKRMNLNSEQLVTAASINMVKTLHQLEKLMKSMKAKQIVPAIIGGLDFPKDNLPVKWVDKTGRPRPGYEATIEVFAMIQRIISDRYMLTQKHVIDQIKRHKEAEEAARKLEEKAKDLDENDDNTNEESNTQTQEGNNE